MMKNMGRALCRGFGPLSSVKKNGSEESCKVYPPVAVGLCCCKGWWKLLGTTSSNIIWIQQLSWEFVQGWPHVLYYFFLEQQALFHRELADVKEKVTKLQFDKEKPKHDQGDDAVLVCSRVGPRLLRSTDIESTDQTTREI